METQKGKGAMLISQQRGGADRRESSLSRGSAGIPAVQSRIVFIMHEATSVQNIQHSWAATSGVKKGCVQKGVKSRMFCAADK